MLYRIDIEDAVNIFDIVFALELLNDFPEEYGGVCEALSDVKELFRDLEAWEHSSQ